MEKDAFVRRVSNDAFVRMFDGLMGNGIDEACRIMNGMDVIDILSKTVDLLSIGYDHCGLTVLISTRKEEEKKKECVGG